jgi:hypothetical protein
VSLPVWHRRVERVSIASENGLPPESGRRNTSSTCSQSRGAGPGLCTQVRFPSPTELYSEACTAARRSRETKASLFLSALHFAAKLGCPCFQINSTAAADRSRPAFIAITRKGHIQRDSGSRHNQFAAINRHFASDYALVWGYARSVQLSHAPEDGLVCGPGARTTAIS